MNWRACFLPLLWFGVKTVLQLVEEVFEPLVYIWQLEAKLDDLLFMWNTVKALSAERLLRFAEEAKTKFKLKRAKILMLIKTNTYSLLKVKRSQMQAKPCMGPKASYKSYIQEKASWLKSRKDYGSYKQPNVILSP